MTKRLTDALIERTTSGAPLPHPQMTALKIHFGERTKRWILQIDSQRHGTRRTYKRVLGHWPEMKLDDALPAGLAARTAIREGRDPNAMPASNLTTLAQAHEKYIAREELGPRSKKDAWGLYKNHLKPRWENESLKRLGDNPMMAEEAHAEITRRSGPVQANQVMRLLRAIYRDSARRDRSLNPAQHPCTSVPWNPEFPAQRAISPEAMPSWAKQCATVKNPIRRQFHRFCLFTGQRPGELARALFEDVGEESLALRDTKKEALVEIPISEQIARELAGLREARRVMGMAGSKWLFPAETARGHMAEWREKCSTLSAWGNAGRHTYKTVATALNVSDMISDLLQGRSLRKAGLAGRGYINRHALGPALREAQARISTEMDRLLGAGLTLI